MKKIYIILFLSALTGACNKQIDAVRPLTQIDAGGELSFVGGIKEATAGTYLLLSSDVLLLDISESRGNNVTLQQFGKITKPTDAYFFQNSNSETLGYSNSFYRNCYRIIVSANLTLEGIANIEKTSFTSLSKEDQNELLYAKGENIFLRAFTYFNLIRVYGKPYYQNAESSSGVPLKTSSSVSDNPQPSSVKAVYDFIVSELQAAAQLMKVPVKKTNSFAGTGCTWALLSRVYLYMGGSIANPDKVFNEASVAYADSVIDYSAGKYVLLKGTDYTNMFGDDESGNLGKAAFENNKEIIWAFSSANGNQVGYLFHYDPDYGIGGVFVPSSDFKSLLTAGDIRGTFLKLNTSSGFVETTKWLCLNYATVTFAPDIYFRLGEVYLNRAEANAKLNNFTNAKSDLEQIHTRAGLPASDISNLPGQNVLAAILKERRIELAFEGHASFDYFRNGLSMMRTAADNNGQAITIEPDDPKVVFTLPDF